MGKMSTLGVLRLRATSAVSRDKSVRRSAQDDVFVVSWRSKKQRLLGLVLPTKQVSAYGASPRLFRPMYPDFLHGAPPTPACAAFIKESRMNFANASKLDRKSGVRLGERGAPVISSDAATKQTP